MVSRFMNVSNGAGKTIAFGGLIFEILIRVDVTVVSRTRRDQLLLLLIDVPVWITTCSPSHLLCTMCRSVVLFDRTGELVVARAWTVNLLWF